MNFFETTIKTHPAYTSPGRCSSLLLLEPVTRAAVEAILADAEAAGRPMMVWETFRSKARQAELFARGASKLREVGVHHYGLACDLVWSLNGDPSWKGDFSLLGRLAKDHGLVWGGSWKSFPDAVHVQRIPVSKQADLFAGRYYP